MPRKYYQSYWELIWMLFYWKHCHVEFMFFLLDISCFVSIVFIGLRVFSLQIHLNTCYLPKISLWKCIFCKNKRSFFYSNKTAFEYKNRMKITTFERMSEFAVHPLVPYWRRIIVKIFFIRLLCRINEYLTHCWTLQTNTNSSLR